MSNRRAAQQPKSGPEFGNVTIDDIARLAGVHPGSVSRALRGGNKKVSSETRARIERIAQDLGYRPNALAASLRTKQTNLIAIVLPDLANPNFAPIAQSVEAELSRHGLMCLLAQTPSSAEGRRALIVALANRQIEGLLILAAEANDPMLDEAARLRLPTVLVNRGSTERRFSSVVNDDQESVHLIMDHLRSLGHTTVAHIAGPQESSTGQVRRAAYESLAAQHGMAPVVVEAKSFTRDAGRLAATQLFESRFRGTAIFAANDLIALGVLDVLHARGLRVPGDVSLVGHNDMPLVDLINPPLTTVRVDFAEMGRQASQLVFEHIRNRDARPTTRLLIPSLVVRQSTGTAPTRPGTTKRLNARAAR